MKNLSNNLVKGQIIKLISDNYYVKYNDDIILCKARGKFKKDNITPLVGDLVNFDSEGKVIVDILPRKNELVRPPISNVDQAVIVISVKEPNFSSLLLDKMLTIIEHHRIKPIICFTKLDLLKDKAEKNDIKQYMKYYKSIGYKVYTNRQLFLLKRLFKHKLTVFTGQSGVGKSSLLNAINKKLQLKTETISTALGRGKHTTRHVELLQLKGGLVADSPGFSALDFIGMTKENIRDNFIEFNKYKDNCEYRNCFHLQEPNCEVKKAIDKGHILLSRYENYTKFMKDVLL
ncbi:MAG: ribosome small subunit-dependent GTPase A [Bacilli bacterium]|jgi:ribosome biogenesis GTPase